MISHASRSALMALAGALFLSSGAFAAPPASAVVTVDLKPAEGSLDTLIAREIAKAKQQKRTPYVELGATWCGPCKHLAASLGDDLMKDAFAGTYIIRLDVDEWKAQLETLGFKNTGIPVFFALDGSGKPTGERIDGGAWGEDIPANMAPPLKAFFSKNNS